MRPGAVRAALLACLLAVLAAVVAGAPRPRQARRATATTPARHVVVVGISGLRWSDVSPSATPTLWRLAGQGSVGSLVDYAVLPLTCPADGWLTLNAGARAQSDHTNAACGAFPAVEPAGSGAVVPAWARWRPTTTSSTTALTGACWPGASPAAPPPSARAPRWRWPTPPGTSRPTCPRPPASPRGCWPAAR